MREKEREDLRRREIKERNRKKNREKNRERK